MGCIKTLLIAIRSVPETVTVTLFLKKDNVYEKVMFVIGIPCFFWTFGFR